ncbi:binding-protein-dependent transport systems inner membrane component [Xylanimonas cellulosilytica DSM 15894]|uniref:Binding-protein-dependent transport systems inner membrane component n=1 Tax=Xylanimonas cellulosilytica (strain DSM 15894 / JCM 12276 / CECT 5975 / KCTC 9989 / LMG 20990 / NBRC 107835 / XIL07) TaxID=446471 RepID=D1BZF6_XYLCX|nr:ABC transporter permease subunit [Xylanimonas cellulosilytica]ACZ30110.1 binding-protein-dependent transport systems inner membrane component [Xylanimonas cellulosilytica DSM 15894]
MTGVLGDALRYLNDPLVWTRRGGLLDLTGQHLLMALVAVGAAAAVALPLGAWLGHSRRGSAAVVAISNTSRALPTLAIILLLATAGLFGNTATVIAAAVFAAPLLLAGAHDGVRGADPAARDAARGLGCSPAAVLWRVEVPLAVPLVAAGVRTAVVQVLATIPLAALAGGGGLGQVIGLGMGTQRYGQVLAGGLLVAALCLVADGVLALAQRLATPRALRALRVS